MKIKPFKALQPNMNLISSPDSFASGAKKNFKDFLTSGMILEQPEKAYFVYRIIDAGQPHTGIITGSSILEYLNNRIKKHEQTLNAKEQLHLHKFLQWNTTMKPILLVYPEVSAISDVIDEVVSQKKPSFEMEFELVPQIHQFWAVTEKTWLDKITELFKNKVRTAYIADGHHRIAGTASLYEKFPKAHYNYAFTAFFSFKEVNILPYNRVINDLNGMTPVHFMALLSKFFKIKPLKKAEIPKRKHQITFLLQHEWYLLTWKKKQINKLKAEDPVLLDSHLLNYFIFPILGITDTKTDKRITYVGGDEGLEGIIRKVGDDPSKVGFYLHPVTIEDMVTLSNLDKTLPPKSTWFEPRLKNGVIMKRFE